MKISSPATAVLLALLSASTNAHAQSAPDVQIGDAYEITYNRQSSEQGSDGSSSSSQDKDTVLETIRGVSGDGVEVEYDLPRDTSADDRASNWQFPVRVLKPLRGPPQLLNREELAARVDGWLKSGGMTRAACGHWIFTWNAFRIECDPDTVMKTLAPFELSSPDLYDGALYRDGDTPASGVLVRTKSGPAGATFTAEIEVDPETVRRARAEADVVVGEITNKPLTLEAALSARAKEAISGTTFVTLDTDSGGHVWRRTRVTKLTIKSPNGKSETSTVTESVERRVAKAAAVH